MGRWEDGLEIEWSEGREGTNEQSDSSTFGILLLLVVHAISKRAIEQMGPFAFGERVGHHEADQNDHNRYQQQYCKKGEWDEGY